MFAPRAGDSKSSVEKERSLPSAYLSDERRRNVFRFPVVPRPTDADSRRRDRARDLPPPLALYAAARRSPGPTRKPPPRWVVPVLVVALILAAGIAAAAYWPFPRPFSTAPLEATVEIDRTSGPHPLSVTVAANVSGGTPPYQYNWSFGDGGTASAASATHQYASHGTYQVLLRVTDRDNRTADGGVTVHVNPVRERPTVLNATAQTLGAGVSSAWVIPLSIPPTEVSTWINGTTNVTTCSLGGNCATYVEILNVHDETNLTRGGAITNPIWCVEVNGTCTANRTVDLAVNLAGLAGQTVYLVVFNTDLVWSQSVTAFVWMDCWY
jgi:PKD domain